MRYHKRMFEATRCQVTPGGANTATVSFGIGLRFLKIIVCVCVHVCIIRGHVYIHVYVYESQRMTLDIVLPQLLFICYIYGCDSCTMLGWLTHWLQRSDHLHLPGSQTHHSWLFDVGSHVCTESTLVSILSLQSTVRFTADKNWKDFNNEFRNVADQKIPCLNPTLKTLQQSWIDKKDFCRVLQTILKVWNSSEVKHIGVYEVLKQ